MLSGCYSKKHSIRWLANRVNTDYLVMMVPAVWSMGVGFG